MKKTLILPFLAVYFLNPFLSADIFVLHDELFRALAPGKSFYIESVDFNSIRIWGPIDKNYDNGDFIREFHDRLRLWDLRGTNSCSYGMKPCRNLLFRTSWPADSRGGISLDLLFRISLTSNWSILSSAAWEPRFPSDTSMIMSDDYIPDNQGDYSFTWTPLQIEYIARRMYFHYDIRIRSQSVAVTHRLILQASPAWSPFVLGGVLQLVSGR